MKIAYLLAALLLVPFLATQATAHVQADKNRIITRLAKRPIIGGRLQGGGIVGRQIAAPPWSAACMNDQGPQQCDEPMWVYGSPDYVAQFKNAF
ncbi:hypothetical protein [Bradyrhizobium sp. ORS 111]|uniref:hypothetical protein n=1 Tax=Bradyrhizobium sp. ORS 111 TaxID=1685958 RepID=UPI00389042A2